MRVEGTVGEGLILVASRPDFELLDLAFSQLLEHATVDDWAIRTGASQEEAAAVWLGIRTALSIPGDREGTRRLPISERVVEIVEAVLFEIARARRIRAADLRSLGATSPEEVQRIWRDANALLRNLALEPAMVELPPPEQVVEPMEIADDDGPLSGFRQLGASVVGIEGYELVVEHGDARNVSIEGCAFRDVAVRDVRLIESRVRDVEITGDLARVAVIDCDMADVRVSATLTRVDFIGNVFADVDLRRSVLVGCRFFEAGPGEQVWVPTGLDSFVVPVASVLPALRVIRGRIGERAFDAIATALEGEEADYISIGPSFWADEVVSRGGDEDPELEEEVLERLHRLAVRSLAGRTDLASGARPRSR